MDSQYRYRREIQDRGYKKRPVAYVTRAGFDMVSVSAPKSKQTSILASTPTSPPQKVSVTGSEQRVTKAVQKPKKSKKKLVYISAIAIIVLTAISSNLFYIYSSNKIQSNTVTEVLGDSTVNEPATTSSSSDVDESDISTETINKYAVAPDLPRYIRIDSLNIQSRVIRVGIDKNNEIMAPKSIYDAGWYEGSNKPNESGAIFIDGHVSGPTKKGIFYNLHKVSIGDIVILETGSGEKIEYKVEAKEYIKPESYDINKALVSFNPDKQGLNLMTCTGEFNSQSQQYEERLVVYTSRL